MVVDWDGIAESVTFFLVVCSAIMVFQSMPASLHPRELGATIASIWHGSGWSTQDSAATVTAAEYAVVTTPSHLMRRWQTLDGSSSSSSESTRYQVFQFGDTPVTRVPVLECTQVHTTRSVYADLLPRLPDLFPTFRHRHHLSMDPADAQRIADERATVVRARKKGRRRCSLDAPTDHYLTLDATMAHLTGDTHPGIPAVVASTVDASAMLAQARVEDVLVGRDRALYYRVLAVVPTAAGDSVLAWRLLRVGDVRRAADEWLRGLRETARTNIDMTPCLCLAHFGVIGSGLHLHYRARSDSDDSGGGVWMLLAMPRFTHHNSQAGMTETSIVYLDYLSRFPHRVNAHFNLTDYFAHSSVSTIAYYDVESTMEGPAGVKRMGSIEPFWILDDYVPTRTRPDTRKDEDDDEDEDGDEDSVFGSSDAPLMAHLQSDAPLLAVVSIESLSSNMPTQLTLKEKDTGCFSYCVLVEQKLRT